MVGVPCTVTVSLTVPVGPSVTEDALNFVAVDVLVGDVVVVVLLVGVVLLVVVVVVVVGNVSDPKRTVPMARSPSVSPMASTQVSPAASCAAVGGQGKLAASVSGFPDVVQPGMVTVTVVLFGAKVTQPMGASEVLSTGGPTCPVFIVCVPVRVPFFFPLDPIAVRLSVEQLTGM